MIPQAGGLGYRVRVALASRLGTEFRGANLSHEDNGMGFLRAGGRVRSRNPGDLRREPLGCNRGGTGPRSG